MNKNNVYLGIFWMVVSAFSFTVMSVFIKLVDDVSILHKTTIRNIIPLIVSTCFILKNKLNFIGKKENLKLIILRCLLGTTGMLLTFYSLSYLSLADSSIIGRLTPIFVVFLSVIFLKEKIKKYQIICLILTLLGTYISINPNFNSNFIPLLSAIIGAFFSAGAYTCLNKIGRQENSNTLVFISSLFSFIILTPLCLFENSNFTITNIIYLILSGIFAVIGQYSITFAYQFAKATDVSIFDYFSVIFSAILGVIIFNNDMYFHNIIGYIIIFLSTFYVYKRKKLNK